MGIYKNKTVKEVMQMIGANQIYLPPIQRSFVWKPDQIKKFFDSIMRGYPIGTFLFWKVTVHNEDYTFYEFIREFSPNVNNPTAARPMLNRDFFAVLDGQQRLGSLYIALQGTYAHKGPGQGNAVPRKLYLNILSEFDNNENDEDNFEFYTKAEVISNTNEKHIWFPVYEVLNWEKQSSANLQIEKLKNAYGNLKNVISDKQDHIIEILGDIWSKLSGDAYPLINYYEIDDGDIDDVLEIFIRVNSGGTKLSKSDLLFSTIVANWTDGREEIEDLLENINKKGDGFKFDKDFIMRACLVLNDSPVSLKTQNFQGNIDGISQNWDAIKSAIEKTVDLMVEFGFDGGRLTSQLAIIPIAYYFFKGGNNTDSSKKDMKIYLIRALLKQIYGGHSDTVLTKIRRIINDSIEDGKNDFPLNELLNADLGKNKSLIITKDDLEEIFKYKKGPYTFMVLSLLYSNLKLDQIHFHQDHIHPKSSFKKKNLKDKFKDWDLKKDMLPNLQLLEGTENQKKNNTPFKEWLENNFTKDDEKRIFLSKNYIPEDVDLSFKNFEDFFERRKKILKEQLREIFKEEKKDSEQTVETSETNTQKKDQNYTGRTIKSFSFDGQVYSVNQWNELLVKVCELLYERHPEDFKNKVLSLKGRTRKYFSETPKKDGLRQPRKINETNLYVDVGFNANFIVNLSKRIAVLFEDEFGIEI